MTTISFALDENSIQNAISQLQDYKQRLHEKNKLFLAELGVVGVETINRNKGEYRSHLVAETWHVNFSGRLQRQNIQMKQRGNIKVSWVNKSGIHTANVSPLMMTEYGSGQFAVTGHRGTFPGQKHAWQDYWTWTDLDGFEHQTHGFVPTRPMNKVWYTVHSQIPYVARRVFSG